MAVTGTGAFDDRSPLARMQRYDLWQLCQQEGIPITWKETKDQLVLKCLGAGIDAHNVPKIETDAALIDIEPPQVNYGALNFFQLRKLCTERGIEWAKTDKRTDLLAKLGA